MNIIVDEEKRKQVEDDINNTIKDLSCSDDSFETRNVNANLLACNILMLIHTDLKIVQEQLTDLKTSINLRK